MRVFQTGCDMRPPKVAEAANAARRLCGEPSEAPAPEGEMRKHLAATQ